MRSLIIAATLALAGGLGAQKASYTFFGRGDASLLQVVQPPRIGGALVVRVPGTAFWRGSGGQWRAWHGFLFTGISNTRHGQLRLPFDTAVLGMVCDWGVNASPWRGDLLTSIEVLQHVPQVGSAPVPVSMSTPIPNDRGLLGFSFFQQYLQLDFWTYTLDNGCQNAFSRGGHGVIGT